MCHCFDARDVFAPDEVDECDQEEKSADPEADDGAQHEGVVWIRQMIFDCFHHFFRRFPESSLNPHQGHNDLFRHLRQLRNVGDSEQNQVQLESRPDGKGES